MAYIKNGEKGSAQTMAIDPTYNAGRLSFRPLEAAGAFRISQRSGTNSGNFSAGGILYAFRYIGGHQCIIQSVRMGIHQITSSGAQANHSHSLYVVRGYTSSETTNITLLSNPNENKMLTDLNSHNVLSHIYTTAAMSGGVGTEEPNAYGCVLFDQPSTLLGQPMQHFFNYTPWSFPLVIKNNEGFRIKADSTVSVGTFQAVICVEWIETKETNLY